MSNFFEQELRKLFEDGEIIDDPRFMGRICMGALGGDLRVRAEFVTMGYADNYEALRLTVLKRTDGEIDKINLRIGEVMGSKKIPSRAEEVKPYIWTYRGTPEWYAYQPAPADYQALRQASANYLDMFRERVPERTQPTPTRSSKRNSGRKAAIER